ncbi:MAG: RluA family pseudouridine synthase [Clostridiales bacterium]|jgi:23S rRNA pseudouridine955/2504/2580 synthase|nr:RluA family pseudouridine synthase [Clostridiales bacterium]
MSVRNGIHTGLPVKLLRAAETLGVPYGVLPMLLRKGEIRLNGKKTYENVTVNHGDEVTVYYAPPSPSVKYEDENILIVYKRKGIKSDGEDGFEGEIRRELCETAVLCHRIDTNTDGIVLFAKNAIAEREIEKAFKNRWIEKKYLALAYGIFKKTGVQKAYLEKDEKAGTVTVSEYPQGEEIETRFEVVETFKEQNLTLLDVTLITGKTHQIRAHLKYLGSFVVGDGKYGNDIVNRRLKAGKQQLTAYKITFHFQNGSVLEYLNGKAVDIKLKVESGKLKIEE